jgi:hypothetical protein
MLTLYCGIRRCKVVGPTLGVVAGAVAAVVAWPVGVLVYCCSRATADRAFSTPVNTYVSVKNCFPI